MERKKIEKRLQIQVSWVVGGGRGSEGGEGTDVCISDGYKMLPTVTRPLPASCFPHYTC